MVCVVYSALLHCLTGQIVQVEADISDGMPGMELVGFLGSEVKEARERVRMAIKNCGFPMPLRRITLNLSPANIRKYGTGFDLPMAVAILQAMGQIPQEATEKAVFFGELNLSGAVTSINGVLPLALCAKKAGFQRCFVPAANAAEAVLAEDMEVYPVSSLHTLMNHLTGTERIHCCKQDVDLSSKSPAYEYDLKYVQGQPIARRGLEIAAAGLHNIVMIGEPGAGKSMLSKCLPSILPPLNTEECLEVSSIYSVAGQLQEGCGLMRERPFVSPHHTVTEVAMTGGGIYPRGGLIALAHKGVLFLDEMPEFKRDALECLRQPLEDREIRINRSSGSYTYPADFMLVGAMNPCPCGAYPDRKRCNCTSTQRRRYLERLSKPLMDRIDICIEVRNVAYEELISDKRQEDSETVRKRVANAQEIQFARFKRAQFNARMSREQIETYCRLDGGCEKIMERSFETYRLSARGYYRVLKVARTIADLDGEDTIREAHLIEALHFRYADLLAEWKGV
ncbi:MAG: YifB family Mg chelatase-like AAA ATPase [Lachnospiraceae bacterium]|nr:YifB family Mg chelatase-like AAA ATPase [Lachnospiraceae bacterium]